MPPAAAGCGGAPPNRLQAKQEIWTLCVKVVCTVLLSPSLVLYASTFVRRPLNDVSCGSAHTEDRPVWIRSSSHHRHTLFDVPNPTLQMVGADLSDPVAWVDVAVTGADAAETGVGEAEKGGDAAAVEAVALAGALLAEATTPLAEEAEQHLVWNGSRHYF